MDTLAILSLTALVAVLLYLILRAVVVHYFRAKEEFVDRLNDKIKKGTIDGQS